MVKKIEKSMKQQRKRWDRKKMKNHKIEGVAIIPKK